MPADIRGSGIRTGGTLEDVAVDALCSARDGMDKVSIAVDQMRQCQGEAQATVEAGNAKLDQIISLLTRIAERLDQQEVLVDRQETAARELKEEMRATRERGAAAR